MVCLLSKLLLNSLFCFRSASSWQRIDGDSLATAETHMRQELVRAGSLAGLALDCSADSKTFSFAF